MSFNAEIFYDHYPIRDAADTVPSRTHWISPHRNKLSQLQGLLKGWGDAVDKTPNVQPNGEAAPIFNKQGEICLNALSQFFAEYKTALREVHDLELSEKHIAAGYGLFSRRIETLRTRSDRVLVAGLAATAFIRSGISVHLIGDESYNNLVLQKLLPMLDYMEISFGQINLGDSEESRRENYNCDITLVSARECAMDFLRDSVNWPKRGNRAHRVVDKLTGRRAKHPTRIMNGLPCAIHLDAQSALIENARAPIVLTQDAHPMHEVEELNRALELAPSMELVTDYIYSGEGLEIAYTPAGKSKIEAWAKEYGGIWLVATAADLMIAIALVAQNVLQKDKHYSVTREQLRWIVPDQLVPGMLYYSKPFLTRVVELAEGCSLSGLHEVVGRASYQHVFNRYIHLSGLSHSAGLSAGEFKDVYSLASGSARSNLHIHSTRVLSDNDAKLVYLKSCLKQEPSPDVCTIYCAGINEQGNELFKTLNDTGMFSQVFTDSEGLSTAIASESLNNGDRILCDAQTLASVAQAIWLSSDLRISLLVLNRSVDWYEDALIKQLDIADRSLSLQVNQVLSYEEEVFQNHSLNVLRRIAPFLTTINFGGSRLFQMLLELRITTIQKQIADESYNVRKNLLTHDQGMQSTLSFSGKGLYE